MEWLLQFNNRYNIRMPSEQLEWHIRLMRQILLPREWCDFRGYIHILGGMILFLLAYVHRNDAVKTMMSARRTNRSQLQETGVLTRSNVRAFMVSLQSKYYCWNQRRLHQVNTKRRLTSVQCNCDAGSYRHRNDIVKQKAADCDVSLRSNIGHRTTIYPFTTT